MLKAKNAMGCDASMRRTKLPSLPIKKAYQLQV